MVADAFDDRGGTGVAHAEALAGDAADERLARRRAVERDVADDDVVLGDERRVTIGMADDDPARQALGEVVVGVALEPQRDAARHEGGEALARGTAEVHVDRAVGQAVATPLPGERGAEQRADGAVHVADRQLDAHLLAPLERGLGEREQLLVERAVEPVVLGLRAIAVLAVVGVLGRHQDRREVEALRLPVVDRGAHVERLHVADGLGDRAEARARRGTRAPLRR